MNALLLDLAELGKGKHLETTGICQDRFVPYHKLVKPAKLFYHFITRAHMKMIGIGKLYLSSNLMKIHGGHRAFNGADGSYIHKYRGLYGTVDRMKLCSFCTPLCFQQLIFCHSSASSFCGNIFTVFQYNLYCIKSKVRSRRKSCCLYCDRSRPINDRYIFTYQNQIIFICFSESHACLPLQIVKVIHCHFKNFVV